jgi:hypothetical protein
MTLDFTGQLSPWWGLGLAAAFALGTWLLYRRETKGAARFAFLLPLLRVATVALVILMLTGPTLRSATNIGEPGRVVVFIDASESMAMSDPHMETARKLLVARGRGWLGEGAVDTSLYAGRGHREAAREAHAGAGRAWQAQLRCAVPGSTWRYLRRAERRFRGRHDPARILARSARRARH